MKASGTMIFFLPLALCLWLFSCTVKNVDETVRIFPDSLLADVHHHPIGINLDYFMDGDRYSNPSRSVTDALKEMGVKYLRYPGGDKSDLNLFSSPPYEKAQPLLARTGKGAVDDYERILKNHREFKFDVLDFDEFMTMCRNIHAEPVVTVPADSYLKKYPPGCTFTGRAALIKHAVEWVRYANIKKHYGVKYWMIGNECWHSNNPNSTAAIYATDVLDFSRAMKAVDPTIAVIPNGNSTDDFKTLIKIAGNNIDYLCVSNYPVYNYHAGYLTYRDTLHYLMDPVDRASKAIEEEADDAQKKKLKLIVAEYGPFDWGNKWPHMNDMGHTLANFEMTGEQLIRPEIAFSCFWNTRWIDNDSIENSVFDALDKNGGFNANGYGLMIWGKYLGDKMIKTTSTLHLRTYASYTPELGKMYVYLINKSDSLKSIRVEMNNRRLVSVVQAWELYGKHPDDCDPVWQQMEIKDPDEHLLIKGTSVTVIEYKVK
jgi:alpha-L-arabinofuranosidase